MQPGPPIVKGLPARSTPLPGGRDRLFPKMMDRNMNHIKKVAIASITCVTLGGAARAQSVVPGGWAPQVGYQTVGSPGAAFGGYGLGGPVYGNFGFPTDGAGPGAPAFNSPRNAYRAQPGMTNAMGPLMDSVRQATRRRRR